MFPRVMNREYDEGISKKIMYIRVRQGLFLALSDIIDAFVVAGKQTSGTKRILSKGLIPHVCVC